MPELLPFPPSSPAQPTSDVDAVASLSYVKTLLADVAARYPVVRPHIEIASFALVLVIDYLRTIKR